MATTSRPFMKFFPADYLADTIGLTTVQHGAYDLLLFQAWICGGVLPNDDTALRRMAKMAPKAWAATRDVVLGKFYMDNGTYRHKRIDREINQMDQSNEQRSKAGSSKRDPAHLVERNPNEVARAVAKTQNQTQTQKEEPSLRSGATGPEGTDIRAALWRDGWPIINKLTGMGETKSRRFLGGLLKDVNDDCQKLYGILRAAESQKPIQAEAWLKKSCQPGKPTRANGKPTGTDNVRELYNMVHGKTGSLDLDPSAITEGH